MPKPKIEISEAQLKQIETMAGIGSTMEQIGLVLGMSGRTLRRNKATNEAVLSAFERGKAVAATKVGGKLFEMAMSGDFKAIQWWESTRTNRAARKEVSGPDGGPQQVAVSESLTKSQALALLAANNIDKK